VTISVVIADDQALVRGGFVVMVRAAADMRVLAEAANGAEAVALVREHHPDVVLMDIRMPLLDGIEAARAITADPATAATRSLILTTFDLDDYVYCALRAGASGFLLKDTAPSTCWRPSGSWPPGTPSWTRASPAASSASSPAAPSSGHAPHPGCSTP
jgi:DNA-binding NarL/FixJ family response regulator